MLHQPTFTESHPETDFLGSEVAAGDIPARTTHPLEQRPPGTVRILLPNFSAVLDIPLHEELMIGRRTSLQDGQVDVDLTPFGGQALGVSRYHALIQVVDNRVFIKDMGSTNGTKLNGNRLESLLPYRLHHGDTLRFGHLEVRIHLIDIPQLAEKELEMRASVDQMLGRLKTIHWGKHDPRHEPSVSNVELMKEFLRRMMLWAEALNMREAWPLFDVAASVRPTVRPDVEQLKMLTRGLYPNMFVRMTCHWTLRWSAVKNSSEVKRLNLPDPYEPLLQMYENGAWFSRGDTSVDIRDSTAITRRISLDPALYQDAPPFIDKM
jgi:pSer/pThr/pTyr-binding forkhead associated (FHA) protein